MNNRIYRMAWCLCVMWMSSCGPALARSVNPKHLQKIQPAIEYRLGTDVAVEGYNITYTVRAGLYRLMYRDRRGAYLVGDGECLHLDIHTPKITGTNDWICGLYLPDAPEVGASFYRVRPETPLRHELGWLPNAIIRYGFGSFDWPDKAESMPLREALLAGKPAVP